MKDRLDFSLLRALLRKDRQERAAAFKKGNFNAVGFVFRVLLTLALIAVFVIFFGEFLDIYLKVETNGVQDPSARLYEVLSIVYAAVLIAMIVGAVSQINRALFSADDIRIIAALPVGSKTLFVSKLITIYLGQLAFAPCACCPSISPLPCGFRRAELFISLRRLPACFCLCFRQASHPCWLCRSMR